MLGRRFTRGRGKKGNEGNGSSTLPDSPTDRTLFETSYARRCKELMDLNKDLAALGAGSFLDLPRLAVIGSQSAGKSSLVEAVSGISVPRESGTCTRCPMECSMSTSAKSWSCSISLQISDNADGTPLAAPQTISFVSDLTDKSHVGLWLIRTQAAILNRHLPYGDFKTKSEVELKKAPDPKSLPFSKNMVLIEVKDPDSTDLSFIDLPGLIQNSALNDIALIQNLVESHIEGENTLILATIPMTGE
ncbi:hypothetical protein DXG03_008697 [Asterophora parasitica]|uniref:Dynamin-type G domain-containing protein n=1 Tax=Asterophora parasitica TaxID=117018 RepID=A0A9P7G013_9AGAR|nr:hypothetical protein DXG03_008697 [Asterophora parasitica]